MWFRQICDITELIRWQHTKNYTKFGSREESDIMSYNASAQYGYKKGKGYSVLLEAGSYNPGNQPEYGEDWEYYDVFIHKLFDSMGILVRKKTFHNKKKAKKYFDDMVDAYTK